MRGRVIVSSDKSTGALDGCAGAVVSFQVLPRPALGYIPKACSTRTCRPLRSADFRVLYSVLGRWLASIGRREDLCARLGEQRQLLPPAAPCRGLEGGWRADRGACAVGRHRIPGEKAGASVVGESRSHGRSASAVADRLSLVFHLVDSVTVFLPKRRVVAYERHKRPGLHSRNQLWRRGTAQTFSADVVARIRSRLRLAGLPLVGRASDRAFSRSRGGWALGGRHSTPVCR